MKENPSSVLGRQELFSGNHRTKVMVMRKSIKHERAQNQ
jgi:hypothetical protein